MDFLFNATKFVFLNVSMQLVSAHRRDNIIANVICFMVAKITLVIEVILLFVALAIGIVCMILKKSNRSMLNFLSLWVNFLEIS